jgi:hypothetical protein
MVLSLGIDLSTAEKAGDGIGDCAVIGETANACGSYAGAANLRFDASVYFMKFKELLLCYLMLFH